VSKYYWKQGDGIEVTEEYQAVYRPDGTELAVLTEPEDRWCGRDIAPLIKELNRLHTALQRAIREESS
jgi:hypothetical protein